MSCIFCDISSGKIKSDAVYEDEEIIIFKDINPVAPIHFLAIPKMHIESANMINKENSEVISHIFEKIAVLKDKMNLNDGYRIITNCGKSAGQTVFHLHFHILAGKKLNWPPT